VLGAGDTIDIAVLDGIVPVIIVSTSNLRTPWIIVPPCCIGKRPGS